MCVLFSFISDFDSFGYWLNLLYLFEFFWLVTFHELFFFTEHKKTLQPEQSNVLSELSQSYIDKSSTPVDSNPTHATGTEIYKPKFTWKMTGEPSKKTPKMGQYVEPNPANWTTYKPYNVQVTQSVRIFFGKQSTVW